MTTEEMAKAFLTHVFAHHGLPKAIVSDRGSQFTGLFWGEVTRQLGITRRLSTPYHPETDGAQERSNQEIETYLRLFTTYAQDDWATLLPQAQLTLNNRTASSTGLSPFFFTHGYHQEAVEQALPAEPASDRSPAARAQD